MNTLLLRLSGPMQSWGVQSRFGVRDTGLEPSKSGVIGLVCAALGIPREDDAALARLAAPRMGVRVDREGLLKVDYHTAQNVLRAAGGIKPTELSNRYYLAGAVFLVGLESADLGLLEEIQEGLRRPVWPLFLGRKAFVPGEPVRLGDGLQVRQHLRQALETYPPLAGPPVGGVEQDLRWVIEEETGSVVRPDQPVSFAGRRFMQRRVNVYQQPIPVDGQAVMRQKEDV